MIHFLLSPGPFSGDMSILGGRCSKIALIWKEMPFPNHHGPYLCYSKFPWCITPVSIDHPIIFKYNSPFHWLITKRLCKKGLQVPSEIEVLWKEQLWHRGRDSSIQKFWKKKGEKKAKKKRESSSIWSVPEIGDRHYPWNVNKLKLVTNYP